jgi:hypothetical protein
MDILRRHVCPPSPFCGRRRRHSRSDTKSDGGSTDAFVADGRNQGGHILSRIILPSNNTYVPFFVLVNILVVSSVHVGESLFGFGPRKLQTRRSTGAITRARAYLLRAFRHVKRIKIISLFVLQPCVRIRMEETANGCTLQLALATSNLSLHFIARRSHHVPLPIL